MKYWFDTEFIERPCTIDLISIGIVAEDGRELYLISSEFDESKANDWVRDNVIDKLGGDPRFSREDIRLAIRHFVDNDRTTPEFWAYYADYDWVVFCWLFGTMMDLPKGWPMYCRDVKQWCDQFERPPRLPQQGKGEHNAIADARWNKTAWEFLHMYATVRIQVFGIRLEGATRWVGSESVRDLELCAERASAEDDGEEREFERVDGEFTQEEIDNMGEFDGW